LRFKSLFNTNITWKQNLNRNWIEILANTSNTIHVFPPFNKHNVYKHTQPDLRWKTKHNASPNLRQGPNPFPEFNQSTTELQALANETNTTFSFSTKHTNQQKSPREITPRSHIGVKIFSQRQFGISKSQAWPKNNVRRKSPSTTEPDTEILHAYKKIKTCIYRIIHGLLTTYKLRSIWILKMTTPYFKPLNLRVLASNTAKKANLYGCIWPTNPKYSAKKSY